MTLIESSTPDACRCGETTVHVAYTAPVYAVVEDGRVVRVVVADESIGGSPIGADCAGCGTSDGARVAAARAVATSAAWPAWEVGW